MTGSDVNASERAGARDAANVLAASVRELMLAVVATEARPVTRRGFAARISSLAAELAAEPSRTIDELPSIDDRAALITHYSAGDGTANPVAPVIALAKEEDEVVARVTMGRQYEGPPRFVHGGWTANLFDEVLGKAATWSGYWGLTAQLDTSYKRPVPLERELIIRARIHEVSGRKIVCTGELATAEAPDVVLASAKAIYVVPRPETQSRYFAGVSGGDGVSTENMLPSRRRD